MPYKSMDEINPALTGIEPPITLEQANLIASWADEIENVESPWAVAIAQFKDSYEVKDGVWIKKAVQEVAEARGEGKGVGGEPQGDGGADTCVCPECGATVAHERGIPCAEQECPKCGVVMMGKVEENAERTVADMTIAELADLIKGLLAEVITVPEAVLTEFAKDEEPEVQEAGEPEPVILKEEGQPMQAQMLEQVRVIEATALKEDNPQGPVRMVIEPIQPGWGNNKDKNYYPAQMLKDCAPAFVGAKMFLTDHDPNEHNERNHVSQVQEMVGFSPVGAPRYSVAVYDPYTAQKVRNMKEAGALGALDFSIFANGQRRAATIDGKKGHVVEAIDADPKPIIDWVSRAGAGGRAVSVQEKQTEVKMLEQEQVRAFLSEHASLPQPSIDKLLAETYETEDALKEALDAEVEYVKAVTGSGKPFGMDGEPEKPKTLTEKQRVERFNAILAEVGVGPVPVPQEG